MHRKSIASIAIGSALALTLGGTAYAQGMAQDGMSSDQGTMYQGAAPTGQDINFSDKYKASSLNNLQVKDAQDQDIGQVSEMLIGQDGNVSHVVIGESGFLGVGGQQYVIPWDRLQIDPQQQTASIDVSQDQLSAEFAAFDELPQTLLDQDQTGVSPDQMQQDQMQQDQMQQDPMMDQSQ